MWQACHTGSKEYYYRYTITTFEYYTNQSHSLSSQIGYPDTTMKQIDKEVPGMHITINAIEPCTIHQNE